MVADLDLVVVGGGPAGVSAVLWARALELRFLALDVGDSIGGQLHRVHNRVADYPGLDGANGEAIARAFAEQLERRDIAFRTGSAVEALDAAARTVTVAGERIDAGSIVLATGVRRRRLGVPGEAELAGRGVCPSASKYASEFAGRRVLVVGGGDAALEEALILARACEHVTLAHRGDRFRARPDFRVRVAADPRIDVLMETSLRAIEGRERVERALLDTGGHGCELAVEGVFICVGVEPNSELARDQVDLDDQGYVIADVRGRTSAVGVYVVGDVRSGSSWTIAGAVGDGAAAVKDVSRRLSG